ncbi:MAG TPA: DNA polymerase IV [Candidatus Brocadiia bacterium]|nr:DNA polymerase IV [Candidatus Brocadiia bacterium]
MNPQRRVMHVDADAFFASVEQVLRPELRGKALIVGGVRGSRRAVVASASYEARAKGVHSAMPIAQAVRLCPEAVCIPCNHGVYAGFSSRLMAILRSYSPVVQALSLDDFYLDITGLERLHGPPAQMGQAIRRRVREELGINVTVGIGSSRLIAKVASESAKPNGLREVPAGQEAAFLAPLDIRDLPGAGPATVEALAQRRLRKIGDVAACDPARLERLFGKWGRELWRHARGEDDTPILAEDGPPKSISHETTFEQDTADQEFLEATLLDLVCHVCARLRSHGMTARTVTVQVRFSDFRTVSASRTLPAASRHDDEFYDAAVERLRHLRRQGGLVRLLGAGVSGLSPHTLRQADFTTDELYSKRERLYQGIDAVRGRHGFDAITAARALRPPGPRQEKHKRER